MTRDHEPRQDVDAPERLFDLHEVLVLGLGRTRWVALGLVAAGTIAGLFVAAIQPNTYVSEAKLLLRLGEREHLTPEVLVGAEASRDSRPTMQDEIHLLSDAAVYEKVARELGPEAVLAPVDPRRADGPNTPWHVRAMHQVQSWFVRVPDGVASGGTKDKSTQIAAKILQATTSLYTDRNSNVITVVHTSTSPEAAHTAANALVSAFIQRHRDQFSMEQYLEESGEQLQAAGKDRDVANANWDAHVKECGFSDLVTQRSALLTEVSTIEAELARGRVRVDEIAVQTAKLRERLLDKPPTRDVVTPAVTMENPEYTTAVELKRTLLVARRSLVTLALPLDELRRREREYDSQLEQVERDIAALPARILEKPESRTTVANAEHTEIQAKIDDLQLEDVGLDKRIPALVARLAEKRAELARMQSCESVHEQLTARRDEQKRTYADLFERWSKIQALSRIDMKEATNLRVLQPATFSPEKVGPNRAKSLLFGLTLGLVAAVGWAVFVQLTDRRLRYPGTVERVLGVHVLGVVPEADGARGPKEST